MYGLAVLQQALQAYVLDANDSIVDVLAVVAAKHHLPVYRHAYYARLLGVLRLDYPVLQTLMGAAAFTELGCLYVAAYPSSHRSLRWFGDALTTYLENAAAPNSASKETSSLWHEVSRFEWLLTDVFDGPDQTILSVAEMSAQPIAAWPALCFELHATVKRWDFCWNVIELWKQAHTPVTCLPNQEIAPIPHVIWRHGLKVQFRTLTREEAFCLNAMQNGKTLGEICEGLCDWMAPEVVGMQTAVMLKRFILEGLIHRIKPYA